MPAATPLPRGPSVLTLYSAMDLLTSPGCPVCRYAAEASDRYLRWFALEGHAQPDTITRLCGSLGTCASHTRRLMSQPGASVRLTAVYRYVVMAARDRLTGRAERLPACPACDHDTAATGRALDTLIEGLSDQATRYRCRQLGGVCLPHLATAATTARREPVAWLTETMRDAIGKVGTPRYGWVVGTDPDAEARAALRSALRSTGGWTPVACAPCLAGAHAERNALERLAGPAIDAPDPSLVLCAGHLADAATAAGHDSGPVLVAWQADCLTARIAARPTRWLPAGRQRRTVGDCAVCQARDAAARRTLADGTAAAQAGTGPALCVRHHLSLRAANPRAGDALARAVVNAADGLISDLADAFDRAAAARSRGAAARDSGAWRRAAAFLDGAVFGGLQAGAQ